MNLLTLVKFGYVVFFLGLCVFAYQRVDAARIKPIPYVAQPVNPTANAARGTAAVLADAQRGDAAAEFEAGRRYAQGLGVPQDYATAAAWYAKAAAQGNVAAEASLGWAYHIGAGVPPDEDVAAKWLGLAAAHGDAEAARRLKLVQVAPAPIEVATAGVQR